MESSYRRRFLMGAGGIVMGLPFLEGLAPRTARAAGASVPAFALFYRKPNGVAQKMRQNGRGFQEERFWPDLASGTALLASNCPDGNARATGELSAKYWSRATLVRGLSHPFTDWGHETGVQQMFTGARLDWNLIEGCERCWHSYTLHGESLDNRIARELTGREESLAMGYGHNGSPCSFLRAQSSRGSRVERTFSTNYSELFDQLFSNLNTDAASFERLRANKKSVNDALRTRLKALRANPKLSKADQERLDLHLSSIRDLEKLLCAPGADGSLRADAVRIEPLQGGWPEGHGRRDTADVASRIAALAISCGLSRSVVYNGYPSHGDDTHYDDEFSGEWAGLGKMHEDVSHGNCADPRIARAYQVADQSHLRMFRKFLDRLDAYDLGGSSLLDAGVCVFASDIGQGCHTISDVPYIYVGGAGGKLKTGLYVDKLKTDANAARNSNANDPAERMKHFEPPVRLLNTIGAAVGCKSNDGGPLEDFNADNNGGLKGRFSDLVTG